MSETLAENPKPNAVKRRPPPPPRRTGQLSGVQVVFAVILAVGLLLAINFSSRLAAGQELTTAYDNILDEIEALETEQASLIQDKTFAESDAYVEQWAREQGKMIRPGENLAFSVPMGVPDEAAADAVATTPPVAFDDGIPEPENWELWWALFFDTDPPQLAGESE